MKYFCVIILGVFLAISCNEQREKIDAGAANKAQVPEKADTVQPVSIPDDSLLINTSSQILLVLKARDFYQFAAFIHPRKGVRFSPYGYVDTLMHRSFLPQQFINSFKNGLKIHWGYYDGSGDSIKLKMPEYFNRFVYNADFANAKQTSINKMIGGGNSLNNLETIYKNADFTESHFPGFDPKFAGMDWCSLRLVFEKEGRKFFLIAVIHDQWTI